MIREFFVTVDQVEEDADNEIIAEIIRTAVLLAFPYNDTEVTCADQ